MKIEFKDLASANLFLMLLTDANIDFTIDKVAGVREATFDDEHAGLVNQLMHAATGAMQQLVKDWNEACKKFNEVPEAKIWTPPALQIVKS